MLVTWMNGWVWRLELKMIGLDPGGYVTGYLKTKITICLTGLANAWSISFHSG